MKIEVGKKYKFKLLAGKYFSLKSDKTITIESDAGISIREVLEAKKDCPLYFVARVKKLIPYGHNDVNIVVYEIQEYSHA